MVRKSLIVGAALSAVLAAVAWGYDSSANAHPQHGMMGSGHGMMGGSGAGDETFDCPGYRAGWMQDDRDSGPGWMHGRRGYGHGWMHDGRGYGPGRMQDRSGRYGSPNDLKLTTDQVKSRLDQWLARRGNPRLKVGDVREKDADTIVADIVTKDNSLVQRFVVNRRTGDFERSGD